MVYPGACHNRFQHALGATYLMTKALDSLKEKGVEITEKECEAACLAILCHDIGHGPFSHCLEFELVDLHHENISLLYFDYFIEHFGSPFALAKEIFAGTYYKSFLHELVSSQLDTDRMDYLSRDSFFTGVAEGVIGFDRIINMMNVVDNQLVVEEKGVYSVEKFLMARHLMYLQVYLHKTSLAAEHMLKNFVRRLKKVYKKVETNNILLGLQAPSREFSTNEFLEEYSRLDDHDVWNLLKLERKSKDPILKFLSNSLIERRIFKVYLKDDVRLDEKKGDFLDSLASNDFVKDDIVSFLMYDVSEESKAYHIDKEIIRILRKDGSIVPIEELSSFKIDISILRKDYSIIPMAFLQE